MAFDPIIIEDHLKELASRSTFDAEYVQHPNYSIVSDYLTGKTTTLHGIVPANESYLLFHLAELLESVEQPTANDKLLLDVLFHPNILPNIQYNFLNALARTAIAKNSDACIQGAHGLFKRAGYNTDQEFLTYISAMRYVEDSYMILMQDDAPLKRYLLLILPATLLAGQHSSLRSSWAPGHHWGYSSDHWNFYYFLLLEEGKPHLVPDYIIFGLITNPSETGPVLFRHKGGKYLPLITQWVQQTPYDHRAQVKFQTAIVLYEWKPEEYRELVTALSKVYLDQHQQRANKDSWESGFHLAEFKDTDFSYLTYSAAALHFVIQADRDRIKELVFEWFRNKVFVSYDILKLLHYHLRQDALPYLKLGLQADTSVGGIDYYRKIISLLALEFEPAQYLEIIWGLVTTKSKPLRELIARILTETDEEAESKAVRLLAHKSADARQAGAMILSNFTSEKALGAVTGLLDTETNDNTRDIFLQIIAPHLPRQANEALIGRLVASAQQRGKLAKPIEAWLAEEELPALFYISGRQLTTEEVRFLLYRMSRVKGMRSDLEARYLIDQLDREKAAPFAKHIIKLYMDKEAKPEHKYLLALAALLGNDEIVDKIRSVINHWIDTNRFKMAEHGVGALALQGSDKALRWVEWYSRKYKNKKANVGAAALQALQDAAEELGITTHELGDRIVPDFGFNGLFKDFTINDEEYRAFIDSNFKLCFFNEDNKKLKSLPAAAGAELKEQFKMIGKEVRDVVRSQADRLEHYLVIQRKWTTEQWQQFYLNNPVMFIYATKLLWGIYNAQGELRGTFACLEDTSLVNVQGDEIELKEGSLVGIVHPLHLSEADLQAWKRQFFDLSIEPIFPQLDRPVFALDPKDGHRKIITDDADKAAQPGAIRSTMEKKGWKKGDTGDGGSIDSYLLEDTTSGITAHLEVSGIFVGSWDADYDPKLGRLYFIDRNKPATSPWFSPPADEKDARLVALKDLPPILYSEVRAAVSAIKLKSVEASATT